MEKNQEINWEWESDTNNPSLNENPTTENTIWGTEENKEIENFSWENETFNENQEEDLSEDRVNPYNFPENDSINRNYTHLGNITNYEISSILYNLNFNLSELIQDLEQNSKKLNDDGKFSINPVEGSISSEILNNFKLIANSHGLSPEYCFLYKNEPLESSINIFKNTNAKRKNFIYFLQGDYNSGEVILDLSSINGPSTKILDTTPGILAIFPGWVPYKITKNLSKTTFIALAGSFA